jgi:hypothetical protein
MQLKKIINIKINKKTNNLTFKIFKIAKKYLY